MRAALTILMVSQAAGSATAETLCNPNDNAARILSSASPNAVHPKWGGQSYIGTSWSLSTNGRVIKNETGEPAR